jgi:hypothetical protein
MPTYYDTMISVAGMARNGAFYLLEEAAKTRRAAIAGDIPRAFAISTARALLANAHLRDRSARREAELVDRGSPPAVRRAVGCRDR